jgi:peroxiredoxin
MREAAKVLLVVAIVAGAAYGFVSLQDKKAWALQAGSVAPTFRLPTLAGGEVDLSSYRGRIVLVNVWATWCPPCVEELPSLEKLHRALGGEGLVVLSVSADEDEAALRRFVAEHGVTFPVLRDPGGRLVAAALYHATGYPETHVIDANGILRESVIGPAEWATPAAIDHFRDLIKNRSTSPTK